jgi:hypothetical protein
MRISAVTNHDLAQSLTTLMSDLDQELATYKDPVTFRVLVVGTPQTVRAIATKSTALRVNRCETPFAKPS